MKKALAGLTLLLAAACADQPAPVAPEQSASAAPVPAPAASDTGWVVTPAGKYRRECVHEVPQGAQVDRAGRVRRRDGSTFQLPWCSRPERAPEAGARVVAPVNDGWIEWASFNNSSGNNFSRIEANWTVPATPIGTYSGQQIYYSFPGLQSSDYVLQPVIQYGYNGRFGGSYWTAASWHCNDGTNCSHSPPISMLAGDGVFGSVASSACSGGQCRWTVTLTNLRTGASTTHAVTHTQNYYRSVGGAVEVNDLTSCNQYPRRGVFYTNVKVYDAAGVQVPSPFWMPNIQSPLSPSCDFTLSYSNSTVSLYHNTAPVVNTVSTSPSPPRQYQPWTLTLNGADFDPATVQVRLLGSSGGSCPPPNGCAANSFTSKTATQLVVYPVSLSMTGSYLVQARNGSGSWSGSSPSVTVVPLYP